MLTFPCRIIQFHPYLNVLPKADPKLSNLFHIWQTWGFPLDTDAEQSFRTRGLVRGTVPWSVFCASLWEAARSGRAYSEQIFAVILLEVRLCAAFEAIETQLIPSQTPPCSKHTAEAAEVV